MRVTFRQLAQAYGAFKNVMLRPNQTSSYLDLAHWAKENGHGELEALATSASQNLIDSEASFNRLCVGPARLLVVPYESVWRSGEAILNNHFTAAVAYAYAEAGLVTAKEDANDMADYFPLELEFLFYLASLEVQQRQAGQEDIANALAETHDIFWSEHLGHWAKGFLELFIKESDSAFWAEFGKTLLLFLIQNNGHLPLSEKMTGVETVIAPPTSLKGKTK